MDIKVIDFHVHPFLRQSCGTCFFDGTVSEDCFVNDLKRAGISMCCGSVIERNDGNNFDVIKRLNDEAAELQKKYGGYYVPGIHVHPNFVEQSAAEIERMYAAGVRLIGELVPYYMGWDSYSSKNFLDILSAADNKNMVVSAHTAADNPKLAASLEEAAKQYKNITFAAAHPGTKASFEEHLKRIKKYDNYYLDLSGTGIFRYGMIKHAVDTVGSEKILFGTDFPICNPSMYVNAVLYEKISSQDKENILHKNTERILGIKAK